jgi:phenylalanyl-tRNA synthetase alpha chain
MTLEQLPKFTTFSDEELDAGFALLTDAIKQDEAHVISAESLETFRLKWTGRRAGLIRLFSEQLKTAPKDRVRAFGERFNTLNKQVAGVRETTNEVFTFRQHSLALDITLPGTVRAPGIAHPLLNTMERVVEVFHNLGYSTQLGPQVETDFFNFEALNFPPNHPARDTQDTLQIAAQSAKPGRDRLLMRTHTSPVQIRTMLRQDPPLRIVIPGKVHRNDAADATHSPIFHQVEGLAVGPDVTFSDLKGTLAHAMRALFGASVKTRFFPSFFPFTEPSADVQISCIFCNGRGCRKCKHSGWIELLGCGMVDPAVFTAVADERRRLGLDPAPYDPARVSGFAFGMGVERIAMILHGVSDIGLFYSGDMRFLEQFA